MLLSIFRKNHQHKKLLHTSTRHIRLLSKLRLHNSNLPTNPIPKSKLELYHKIQQYPVLHVPILQLLKTHFSTQINQNKPIYMADCTFSGGNHSKYFLSHLPSLKVVGMDIDPYAVGYAEECFKDSYLRQERLRLMHTNYVNIDNFELKSQFQEARLDKHFDVVFLDLGMSSYQMNDYSRGFAFQEQENVGGKSKGEKLAILDMRYNLKRTGNATAAEILNNASVMELKEIFTHFGDLKGGDANVLVEAIVKHRNDKLFEDTAPFVSLIHNTMKESKVNEKYKIIRKVFQALRIAVNFELLNLDRVLEKVLNVIDDNGLVVIITFHSAEEKIVMNYFLNWEKEGYGQLYWRKSVLPSKEELSTNTRSHSAKLRVFWKTG